MPCLPRESLQPGRGWHQHGVNLVDNLGRAPDNIVSSNNIVHGCQFVRDVVLSGIWNLVTVMMEQQQGPDPLHPRAASPLGPSGGAVTSAVAVEGTP